ncbi:hypothetical protein B0A49_12711 [Cryomyces minteri]|uniref:Protein kinase domain-containing protein n=1 Tax=Cryomyces minteri TaxID=331657 RepID=A0A4U0WBI6_9PEZI|nr:hypothetical protein B0A49_12711 [Cryomyces minteri]
MIVKSPDSRSPTPHGSRTDTLTVEVDPSQMYFIQRLKQSDVSALFLVEYNKERRVLKVVGHAGYVPVLLLMHVEFHNNGDPGFSRDGLRDLDRYRCEARAYRNLKSHAICAQGYVPEIYGRIEQLHPSDFAPHLDAFLSDSYLPNAILIEYLLDAQQMNCSTYTKKRMATAVEGIKKIHEALVEHSDPYPKNILIVPDNLEMGRSERVVWTDFDVAITYEDASCVGEEQKRWMDEETECVEGFGQLLAEDQKQGLSPNTKFY